VKPREARAYADRVLEAYCARGVPLHAAATAGIMELRLRGADTTPAGQAVIQRLESIMAKAKGNK
jgi:hypothetical protein